MKLYYIFHSCFMLEAEQCVIIFDYWKDSPDGDVKHMLEHTDKRVYFMASHFHEDHFNPEIFSLNVPNGQKRIILSRDIVRRRRAKETDADVLLRRGDTYSDDMISVKAFGSTDAGVSFMVETDGKKVFHAGDLNNWHWEDESTPQEVAEAEGNYLKELDIIAKYTQAMDVVMFPVDPRLGTDFMRGAQQFIDRIKTGIFVPMHFWERPAEVMAFAPYAESKGCRYVVLSVPGEGTDI